MIQRLYCIYSCLTFASIELSWCRQRNALSCFVLGIVCAVMLGVSRSSPESFFLRGEFDACSLPLHLSDKTLTPRNTEGIWQVQILPSPPFLSLP